MSAKRKAQRTAAKKKVSKRAPSNQAPEKTNGAKVPLPSFILSESESVQNKMQAILNGSKSIGPHCDVIAASYRQTLDEAVDISVKLKKTREIAQELEGLMAMKQGAAEECARLVHKIATTS